MSNILYICNRQRCENCNEDCYHTSDKEYAVNPKFDPRRFEKDGSGNLWEVDTNHGETIRSEVL